MKLRRIIPLILLVAIALFLEQRGFLSSETDPGPGPASEQSTKRDGSSEGASERSAPVEGTSSEATDDAADILQAFRQKKSGILCESGGTVDRVLADDNTGSRHQRFIVKLTNGVTVLIAHNIDLAPRVPVNRGDTVTFSGQYEWNDRGGVIHWTHHDPQGRHPGGWIRHKGKRYE